MSAGAVWELSVRTWIGRGDERAEHWYGELSTRLGKLACDVESVLTEEAAAKLTRKERDYVWRAGTASGRFDTVQLLEEAALAIFASMAGAGDILIRRDQFGHEPERLLAGPDEAMSRLAAVQDDQPAWRDELSALGYDRYAAPPPGRAERFDRFVVYAADGRTIENVIEEVPWFDAGPLTAPA